MDRHSYIYRHHSADLHLPEMTSSAASPLADYQLLQRADFCGPASGFYPPAPPHQSAYAPHHHMPCSWLPAPPPTPGLPSPAMSPHPSSLHHPHQNNLYQASSSTPSAVGSHSQSSPLILPPPFNGSSPISVSSATTGNRLQPFPISPSPALFFPPPSSTVGMCTGVSGSGMGRKPANSQVELHCHPIFII